MLYTVLVIQDGSKVQEQIKGVGIIKKKQCAVKLCDLQLLDRQKYKVCLSSIKHTQNFVRGSLSHPVLCFSNCVNFAAFSIILYVNFPSADTSLLRIQEIPDSNIGQETRGFYQFLQANSCIVP